VSRAKTAEAIEMLLRRGRGWVQGTPVASSGPLRVNTVLCPFNIIHHTSLFCVVSVSHPNPISPYTTIITLIIVLMVIHAGNDLDV